METTTNKKEFINRFLSDNLTGVRDAYGFQYDVYATVKRDLANLGFDKSLESTKNLTNVIKHIFFAFVSGDYEIDSLGAYIQYLADLHPEYDLENASALVYEALSICINTEPKQLFESLCQARNNSAMFNDLSLNQIVYPMVLHYLNNIDEIIRVEGQEPSQRRSSIN